MMILDSGLLFWATLYYIFSVFCHIVRRVSYVTAVALLVPEDCPVTQCWLRARQCHVTFGARSAVVTSGIAVAAKCLL